MRNKAWIYVQLSRQGQLPDVTIDTRSCPEQVEYELQLRQERDLNHYRISRINYEREHLVRTCG